MSAAPNLLATMVTTTTYGTWLPGDLRGYVDDGVILPGDPEIHALARGHMIGKPVLVKRDQQTVAFDALVRAADEFDYTLHAASIESWHAHVLVTHAYDKVDVAVGRLKTRMRQAIARGRIWTAGYDKRYCFTDADITNRTQYIRRHHGHRIIPH